ncbi:MAG: RDD family protein [Gammaproteobacteria bacterium]|nr:RDD family protein [Gammaproteobacteria bacterium]
MTAAVRYAGFWRRLGAAVLDLVIYGFASTAVLYLLHGPDYLAWSRDPAMSHDSYAASALLFNRVLPPCLVLAFWTTAGATPGKLLLGCHIRDAQSGGPATLKQALLRLFGYFVSALPLMLGFFWIAWGDRKQGFHDRLANTVVVIEDESQLPLETLERGLT